MLASAQAKATDLRNQAQDLSNQAKAKADDFREQIKADVAEQTEEDIVLSPTDDAVASETFESFEDEVEPEVLEPTTGLSETDKKGLSEEADK